MQTATDNMQSISPYVIPGIKFELMPSLDQWYKAEMIMDKIAGVMEVPVALIQGNSRTYKIAMARQLCSYFIRINTDLPLTEIGKVMGGFHHTSVIHSIVKVKEQISAKHDNVIKDFYYKLLTII